MLLGVDKATFAQGYRQYINQQKFVLALQFQKGVIRKGGCSRCQRGTGAR